MTITDLFRYDDRLDPSNEEILNVIRETDKRGIGTSEIVDVVDLKIDAVRDRLKTLQEEGCVEMGTIGSLKDHNFI